LERWKKIKKLQGLDWDKNRRAVGGTGLWEKGVLAKKELGKKEKREHQTTQRDYE